MSHIDLEFNTMIIDTIAKHCGDLVITSGVKHTLLVMGIKILDDKNLAIGMNSHVQ